jgi:hypothetical protein
MELVSSMVTFRSTPATFRDARRGRRRSGTSSIDLAVSGSLWRTEIREGHKPSRKSKTACQTIDAQVSITIY